MIGFIKKKIASAIDSRRYEWVWEKISDTYFGYYFRRVILKILGINEDAAIRDLVAKDSHVLKMTHPEYHKDRFNVLLVQVPLPANRKNKRILPLGLASLAAYLREKMPDINIGILDAQCQNMEMEEIIDKISEIPWDVVGITYWSVQSNFVSRLSKFLKNQRNETVIIHGGVHTTVKPEEALLSADYAVLNEGEETFFELIRALKEKGSVEGIKGIAYLRDGKFVFNGPRPLIEDMNRLPMPAYDLLPVEKYKMPLHVVGGERLPVMGSRGCPYKCSFCTSPSLWQGKVRWRSPKKVVDEIEWIIKKYAVSKFHFWDDNFTLNPNFVKELCKEILERKLKIQWVALDRAEHINKNKALLPLMREAGCIGIEIGLESANPDTFAHILKQQSIDDSREAIKNLKSAGIFPLYTYMVFNPGESIVGYYMQKEFLDMAQEGYKWHRFFHPFSYPVYVGQFATPYPGTEFWNNLDKESMILVDGPEDRFHHQINSVPYSLLKDIPIKNIPKLDEELYYIFLNAVKLNFWLMFPGNDERSILGQKLFKVWKFVFPFFEKCDGKKTLLSIGKELASELNMLFNDSMRLTVFASYIFAQVGAVRSSIYHRDYCIERKDIDVPISVKRDLISLLKPFGISKGNFVQKANG